MRSNPPRGMRFTDRFAVPGGVVLFILIWYVATSKHFFGKGIGVSFSPEVSIKALISIIGSGEITPHILASMKRISVGLFVAAAAGIPAGLITGYSRIADRATYGTFQFIRMISPLAWMPLAISLFGIGDKPVYFLIAIAAVWPFVINTAFGVKSVEKIWVRVARTYNVRGIRFVKKILLPAALPDILVGLRLALGISWIVLVPAEMLGVSEGLGYYILDTRDRFAYGELIAVIIIIGVLGYATDYAVQVVQKKCSWNKDDSWE